MLTHKRHHRHSPLSTLHSHMATASTFSPFLLILILFLFVTNALDTVETPPPTPNLVPPPPPDTDNTDNPSSQPFRPGIAVVACVLTTMFSLTSLLLLYIKHCNSGNIDGAGSSTPWTVAPFSGRKNSGIERSVVESLPVFRFGALRGQKDGLDCAVCLTKFEGAEVLRLLPKCKHAFHVECVDTWLDAHSTCPLCRYRVDPEDILLVDEGANAKQECVGSGFVDLEKQEIVESKRRHSSVGERERETVTWTTSFRRSLDSVSGIYRKKNNERVSVGCFVRARKDGMLLTQDEDRTRTSTSVERRVEHRIIVSPGPAPGPYPGPIGHNRVQERWSDVQVSDLLYLTSEMIMSEAQTRVGGRRSGTRGNGNGNEEGEDRWAINSNWRSVSEITGLSRECEQHHHQQHQQREEGLVKRWLGWISISKSQPNSS